MMISIMPGNITVKCRRCIGNYFANGYYFSTNPQFLIHSDFLWQDSYYLFISINYMLDINFF